MSAKKQSLSTSIQAAHRKIDSLRDGQDSIKWTLNSARKRLDAIENRLQHLEKFEDFTKMISLRTVIASPLKAAR